MKKIRQVVGILGNGEIGSSVARICKDAGYKVLVRELKYDEIKNNKINILHINVPEKSSNKFINLAVKNINELKPDLTVINSSTTLGVTREIFNQTKANIVHSPVIGLHPNLYESIKYFFKKVIGPTSEKSKKLALAHFKKLGLKTIVYKSSDESEAAKLLDLTYYAWNIIFCKWVKEFCDENKLSFDDVYVKQNELYNEGYSKLLPNVVRPILKPHPGPITGHCTIPDVKLIHKKYKNRFTSFILKENKMRENEVKDIIKQRADFVRQRDKQLKVKK